MFSPFQFFGQAIGGGGFGAGGGGGQQQQPPPNAGGPYGGLETFTAPYGPASFGFGGLPEGTGGLAGLTGRKQAGQYRPDVVARALITGPAAQNWANPLERQFTSYADSIRGGEDVQLRNLAEQAAGAKLGRAYTGQLQAQTRRSAAENVAAARLQAMEAQAERQFGLQRMLATSMFDRMNNSVNERRFKKALKAQEDAASMNFFSNIFGSLLGAGGAIAGAAIGA